MSGTPQQSAIESTMQENRLFPPPPAFVWDGPTARAERDLRLAACDWIVTRAVETGAPVPAAWAAYRSALRDLPQQPGFPGAITWPMPPAS